jgi:hypothetical protein
MSTARRDTTSSRSEAQANSAAAESLMKGELPRESGAQPEVIKAVIKLDDRSMVWAHDVAASDVEALGPFFAIVLVCTTLFGAPMFLQMDYKSLDGWAQKIFIPLIGMLMLPGSLIGAWLCLRLVVDSYAHLHFNRRTQKIYTKEGKLAIQLDWKRVRPFAIPAVGPLPMGGLPLWSLTLIEFSATNPKTWTRQMRVQGLLPDRDSCQRVWEAVRRYMDEDPASLPPLEVLPDPTRSWQAAILDFGPAQMFDRIKTAQDAALGATGRLRQRNWWPTINPMVLFYWIVFWPAPLSDILYQRFRPKARLPAEWTSDEDPEPGEANPYRCIPMPIDVARGRRKATWILALMCVPCITIGILFWAVWLSPLFTWSWHMWGTVFSSWMH